ncbi:hypothetical protein CVIRNUC_009484 [Coccomyxa viridis]|uniref:Uncharacterized protein n=1 Tax=Coccomyxa viridis TaxID=1274662 RepID=A0AAV1IG36_9CHLO|nr:hypothetical protein CVIRNUC_009484 [Coccomyxa viridis]
MDIERGVHGNDDLWRGGLLLRSLCMSQRFRHQGGPGTLVLMVTQVTHPRWRSQECHDSARELAWGRGMTLQKHKEACAGLLFVRIAL